MTNDPKNPDSGKDPRLSSWGGGNSSQENTPNPFVDVDPAMVDPEEKPVRTQRGENIAKRTFERKAERAKADPNFLNSEEALEAMKDRGATNPPPKKGGPENHKRIKHNRRFLGDVDGDLIVPRMPSDFISNLDETTERFCQLVASGVPMGTAHTMAGFPGGTPENAMKRARMAMRRPMVVARIEEIRRELNAKDEERAAAEGREPLPVVHNPDVDPLTVNRQKIPQLTDHYETTRSAANRLGINPAWLIEKLKEVIERGISTVQLTPALKAIEMLGAQFDMTFEPVKRAAIPTDDGKNRGAPAREVPSVSVLIQMHTEDATRLRAAAAHEGIPIADEIVETTPTIEEDDDLPTA